MCGCDRICAHCRHWMIGTLDGGSRFVATVNGKTYQCHVKRQYVGGCCTCRDFDKAQLTNPET